MTDIIMYILGGIGILLTSGIVSFFVSRKSIKEKIDAGKEIGKSEEKDEERDDSIEEADEQIDKNKEIIEKSKEAIKKAKELRGE